MTTATVLERKNRLTGTPVVVYDIGNRSGAARYLVVCGRHGITGVARTKRTAVSLARNPILFCTECLALAKEWARGGAIMTTATGRYRVLDSDGKVRQWLTEGRGVRVWRNQEIGVTRADILTPADGPEVAPHWAYKGGLARTISGLDGCLFFEQVGIEREWSDTVAGWRAAEAYMAKGKHAEPAERAAFLGTVYNEWTLEHIAWQTMQRIGVGGPNERALGRRFMVACVQWTTIEMKNS